MTTKNGICAEHGEDHRAFMCVHLVGSDVGLGFNRNDPDTDNPFPDAWCDNCELLRAAYGGWNAESEKLTKIVAVCSRCYQRARVRNTKPAVSFNDLQTLRWRCSGCDEWHYGPCLDFGFSAPYYWNTNFRNEADTGDHVASLLACDTFLTSDYCGIEGRDFFVRGVIEVPIIGSAEALRWGVWGSLSRDNFQRLLNREDDPKRIELVPMFSWLSTKLPAYPDTLNLHMSLTVQEVGSRPEFHLRAADHPLAQEYYNGISPERVRDIMMRQLGAAPK